MIILNNWVRQIKTKYVTKYKNIKKSGFECGSLDCFLLCVSARPCAPLFAQTLKTLKSQKSGFECGSLDYTCVCPFVYPLFAQNQTKFQNIKNNV